VPFLAVVGRRYISNALDLKYDPLSRSTCSILPRARLLLASFRSTANDGHGFEMYRAPSGGKGKACVREATEQERKAIELRRYRWAYVPLYDGGACIFATQRSVGIDVFARPAEAAAFIAALRRDIAYEVPLREIAPGRQKS